MKNKDNKKLETGSSAKMRAKGYYPVDIIINTDQVKDSPKNYLIHPDDADIVVSILNGFQGVPVEAVPVFNSFKTLKKHCSRAGIDIYEWMEKN